MQCQLLCYLVNSIISGQNDITMLVQLTSDDEPVQYRHTTTHILFRIQLFD